MPDRRWLRRALHEVDSDDVEPTLWNDDWDGTPLVLGDHLFAGGENSRLHIIRLNRGYDESGAVTVDPELVFDAAGWDDELLEAVGENVSIESSVSISGNTLYFANSGGLVQGWDIGGLDDGIDPERVFRYWTGDDTDASVVIWSWTPSPWHSAIVNPMVLSCITLIVAHSTPVMTSEIYSRNITSTAA